MRRGLGTNPLDTILPAPSAPRDAPTVEAETRVLVNFRVPENLERRLHALWWARRGTADERTKDQLGAEALEAFVEAAETANGGPFPEPPVGRRRR